MSALVARAIRKCATCGHRSLDCTCPGQVVYILMGTDGGTYGPCAVFVEQAAAEARAAKMNAHREEFGECEWTVQAWSVSQ